MEARLWVGLQYGPIDTQLSRLLSRAVQTPYLGCGGCRTPRSSRRLTSVRCLRWESHLKVFVNAPFFEGLPLIAGYLGSFLRSRALRDEVRVRETCTNYIYDSGWGYSPQFYSSMPVQAGLPQVPALDLAMRTQTLKWDMQTEAGPVATVVGTWTGSTCPSKNSTGQRAIRKPLDWIGDGPQPLWWDRQLKYDINSLWERKQRLFILQIPTTHVSSHLTCSSQINKFLISSAKQRVHAVQIGDCGVFGACLHIPEPSYVKFQHKPLRTFFWFTFQARDKWQGLWRHDNPWFCWWILGILILLTTPAAY